MGLGNEDDVHTAHWHGITVQKRNRRNVDSLVIVPGVTHTVDSLADNPGNWLMHCHVSPCPPTALCTSHDNHGDMLSSTASVDQPLPGFCHSRESPGSLFR
jgi:hypothetical protein